MSLLSPPSNWEQSRLLHHKEARGESLTPSEKTMVNTFRFMVNQAEVLRNDALAEQAESRIEAKVARNDKLGALLERQMVLRERLAATLREAEAERQAIAHERYQIEQAVSEAFEIAHS